MNYANYATKYPRAHGSRFDGTIKDVKPITGDDVYKAIKENLASLSYMYRICPCGPEAGFDKCTRLSIEELMDSIEDKNVKFIIIEQEWE